MYAHGLRGFPIPGLGVVKVVELPEKVIEHKFGSRKGQSVRMPPRKKLSFHFTTTGAGGLLKQRPVPDVLVVNWYPDPEEDLE